MDDKKKDSTVSRSIGIAAQNEKRLAPPFEITPSGTKDRCNPGRILRDEMVPMSDGVRLATDVYLPDREGPFPTILTRMPYGKTELYCHMPLTGEFWSKKGYAFVAQDVRGKWGSEGVFEPNSNKNEVTDGYDTIEWITNQSWSNHRIGMWGESYYGFTTYAGAVSQHSDLVCIAPGDISLDRYRATYRNGALQLNTVGMWAISMMAQEYQDIELVDPWHLPLAEMANAAGVPSAYFDHVIANPTRSKFWKERSLLEGYEEIRIPVLHWGGWYDNYLGPVISDWEILRKRNLGSGHNHLFIGPWDHDGTADKLHRVGRLNVGDGTAKHRWDTFQAFFDHYLMGLDNGFDISSKVQIFVMGANTWRDEKEWPPVGTKYTKYYLHSKGNANSLHGDGMLDTQLPDEEPVDNYAYDPMDPVADTLDMDCWSFAGEMDDRREVEGRRDVLVYTTATLESDIELTGSVTARLYAASSAVDTDFTITLVDVFEDGYANQIQDGIIRASYRDSDIRSSLIEPGRVYGYDVDLWATSYVVKKGHRIRVEVSSSCFNKYDRNPNTGESFGAAVKSVQAKQTIHHSKLYPSCVTLPVKG